MPVRYKKDFPARSFQYGLIFFMIGYFGFSQSFNWAKQFGNHVFSDYVYPAKCVSDTNSNIYITGYFKGISDFDPGPGTFTLTSTGGTTNSFICKINSAGNLIWAINFTGDSQGTSIALDDSANVYVTGWFSNNTDFDPGPGTTTLSTSSLNSIYLCKVSTAGNLMWAKAISSSGAILGNDIAVDISKNVLLTGAFKNSVDFDPGPMSYTINSPSNYNIFVSKYNSSGGLIWARSMGAVIDDDFGYAIAADNSNNVYTTGSFYTWSSNLADFDPGPGTYTLASMWDDDIFISKLDSNGNFVWAKSMGSSSFGNEWGKSIDLDQNKNVYVTGSFMATGTNDFDPGPATYTLSGSVREAFVSKLDSLGNFIWAGSIGGSKADDGNSVHIDAFGNVFVGGVFEGTGDLDPGPNVYSVTAPTVAACCDYDGFITKLNSNGTLLWAGTIAGYDYEPINSITTDKYGDIYSSGSFGAFSSTVGVDVDPGSGTYILNNPNSGYDMFLLKLSSCTSPVTPTNITAPANQSLCAGNTTTLGAVASSGIINWYNSGTSTLSIGGGTSYIVPLLPAGNYTYYAEVSGCWPVPSRIPVTFTVKAVPVLTISANPGISCAGQTVTLTVGGASGYMWSTSSTSSIITVNPSVTTSYSVTGNSQGCTSSAIYWAGIDSPTVTINTFFTTLCKGDTIVMSASGAFTYSWFPGPANPTIAISPTVSSTYSVIGSSVNNCTNSSSINITVYNTPTVSVSATDSVICAGMGTSVYLTASGAPSYVWNNTTISQFYTATPSVTTTYTVKGVDANYCSDTETFTIRVDSCIGIPEYIMDAEIKLYPNPSHGAVNLETLYPHHEMTLLLRNSIGQILLDNKISDAITRLDISFLSGGIYFIEIISSDKSTKWYKLVKE